jgi:hypothetical protein
MAIYDMTTRRARVLKETAGDGPSSYVVRIYDPDGRLENFFDSDTLNSRAALEFVILAVKGLDVVEFGKECSELEELWKKNLRGRAK